MSASFQKKEKGFDHQVSMPNVLMPELLLTDFQQAEKHKDDFPDKYKMFLKAHPEIFEFKPVETPIFLQKKNQAPKSHFWFRLKDTINKPLSIHHQLLAFASDYGLLSTSTLPHREEISSSMAYYASLDHALWFHRDFSINDWLLYDVESPSASNSRGFSRGNIFNVDYLMFGAPSKIALSANSLNFSKLSIK
jgi:acyl-CoA thioesterase-2